MKAVLSAICAFEAIVLALAIPVAISLEQVSGATAGIVGGGLAVVAAVSAGLVRRRAGLVLGSALQVVTFALGFVVPVMFALGVVFGALWIWALVQGRRLAARTAARDRAAARAADTPEPAASEAPEAPEAVEPGASDPARS